MTTIEEIKKFIGINRVWFYLKLFNSIRSIHFIPANAVKQKQE
jgi:hypothetical protein